MNILTIIIYGFPLAGRKGNKKPLGRNQFRIKVKHGETRVNTAKHGETRGNKKKLDQHTKTHCSSRGPKASHH